MAAKKGSVLLVMPATTPTPEPGSWMLGLLGFSALRRKGPGRLADRRGADTLTLELASAVATTIETGVSPPRGLWLTSDNTYCSPLCSRRGAAGWGSCSGLGMLCFFCAS